MDQGRIPLLIPVPPRVPRVRPVSVPGENAHIYLNRTIDDRRTQTIHLWEVLRDPEAYG